MEIRALRRDEIGEASHLLGRAFEGDPFIANLLRSKRRRDLAYPPFFRSLMYEFATSGEMYAAEEGRRLVGTAIWLPPEPAEPTSSDCRQARMNRAAVRWLFPFAARRLFAAFDEIGRHHPAEPHWYLAFVGIEPGLQSRGTGSALLAPVLEKARDACYLETPFERTHPFYERLGFRHTAKLHPVDGGPPVWTMTRPPA